MRNAGSFALFLVTFLFSIHWVLVKSTSEDVHYFGGEGSMTPQKMLNKYPLLLQIMKEENSAVIPVDKIIKSYPKLWQAFKDDPPVWAWFKKNLPQYTLNRPEVPSAQRPFKALSAGIHFLVQVEKRLLADYNGDARMAGQAPNPVGDQIAELFAELQAYRWQLKKLVNAYVHCRLSAFSSTLSASYISVDY